MRRAIGSPSFRFTTMPSRHISCRRSRSPSGIVRKSEGMVGAQFITFVNRPPVMVKSRESVMKALEDLEFLREIALDSNG
ncbi:hypothetical protein C8R44DRAFT_814602, partial [Mycena epipterygia]